MGCPGKSRRSVSRRGIVGLLISCLGVKYAAHIQSTDDSGRGIANAFAGTYRKRFLTPAEVGEPGWDRTIDLLIERLRLCHFITLLFTA
jgi:hypothetical protein